MGFQQIVGLEPGKSFGRLTRRLESDGRSQKEDSGEKGRSHWKYPVMSMIRFRFAPEVTWIW